MYSSLNLITRMMIIAIPPNTHTHRVFILFSRCKMVFDIILYAHDSGEWIRKLPFQGGDKPYIPIRSTHFTISRNNNFSSSIASTSLSINMEDFDSSFILSNDVGNFAAFLTGFEFVVATVEIMCIGAVLKGFWLTRLQVKRKITLKKSSLKYRLLSKEFIAFLIALWFAVGIALVESNLDTKLLVRNEPVKSKTCAHIDLLYDPYTFSSAHPPYSYSADDWSINIGKQLLCDETGLKTCEFSPLIWMANMAPWMSNSLKLQRRCASMQLRHRTIISPK